MGYHAEEIADGVHWVTSGWYDCMFIRTGSGVIAVDAPPALGELLLTAIEEVTDEPVTHFIYSHWHADHVGAAAVFGPNVKRYGHEKARELLSRFPDPNRAPPTETSVPFTPSKRDSTYRTETNPIKIPALAPSITIAITRTVTSRAMLPAAAPSAILTPGSRSRCTTE
jgi:glyoxylase-like metal-dependent hydrolase (beta-lactamase superfamily II)